MAVIVTRAGKGSPLTNAEVDQNFLNLNAAVVAAPGDVVGPAGATDSFLVRFDGVTGKLLKSSLWQISDTGHLLPSLSNTYDIGSVGNGGPRVGYFGGRVQVDLSNLGQRALSPSAVFYGAGAVALGIYAQLDGYQVAPVFMGRASMGTPAAPTATVAGLALVQLDGRGYGATGYSTARGIVDVAASENWTDAAQGASIRFATTINGSNAFAYRWYFSDAGHLSPFTASAYDLGTPAVPLRSGYFSNRLSVNPNGAAGPAAIDAQTLVQLTSAIGARLEFNTFGGGPGIIESRHANGTPAAPTKTTAGSWMSMWGAWGRGATGYSSAATGAILFQAAEDWTDTAHGTQLLLGTTKVGTAALAYKWVISDSGHILPYALDGAYDLGSPSARVRNGYFSGTVQALIVGAGPSAMMSMSGQAGVNSVLYFDVVTPGKLGAFVYQFPGNTLDVILGGIHVGVFNPADQSLTVDGTIRAVNVTAVTTGSGSAVLNPGGSGNSGYLAFFDPTNTRVGYIGFGDTATKTLNIAAEAGYAYRFGQGFSTAGEITFGASFDLVEPRGRYWNRPAPSTSFTLDLNYAGALSVCVSATPTTITIPPQSAVPWKSWTRMDFVQYGAGQVTFAPGAGITLNSAGGKRKTTGIMSAVSLIQINPDEWLLVGDLAL